jgi:signal transduction histidine kinase
VVESLLKFARPGDEHVKEINLHAVIEEALILLGNQMTLRKVVLRKSFQADPLTIDGNPDLLQQVFTNLILNSCNAMPEGGTLTISTRTRERGWGEILFTDTGCGISSENLSKIFDPFFTTMPVGKGTGLGLAIAKQIITRHGGKIWAKSVLGSGSTFVFVLPT